MTRIALIADVHVANHRRWGGTVVGGVNQRGWECVAVLKAASIAAKQHQCSALVVLGDLFDHTRPTPPLVAAVVSALKAGDVPVHVLLGNHDRQSMHELDQACASMGAVPGIYVHSEPKLLHVGGLGIAMVPYVAAEAKDWLAAGLAQLAQSWAPVATRRVCLTHCGIWDDETPAYLKQGKDAIGLGHARWLGEAHSLDLIAAGNWHDRKTWRPRQDSKDPIVLIPGTACPHNFSDPQEHGLVIIYDSVQHAYTGIKLPTPLFLKTDVGPRATLLPGELRNHYSAREPGRAYVRVTASSKDLPLAIELKDLLIKEYPRTIVHIEVQEEAVQLAVRKAAHEAIEAGGSASTLIEFADLAEVAEPGTKAGVVKRLAEYRKAAG